MDAIFELRILMEAYSEQIKKWLYVAFLDLQMAFALDCIPR